MLGAQANERAATPAEARQIAVMLDEAMQAGAWGFTTTANRQHIGHGGKPLAARMASRDELAAYAGVLKRLKRGVIELALTKRYATLAEDEEGLLKFLLDAGGERPVTWLSLSNHPIAGSRRCRKSSRSRWPRTRTCRTRHSWRARCWRMFRSSPT